MHGSRRTSSTWSPPTAVPPRWTRSFKALEQERKTLETKLATTKAGKLDNLPDVRAGSSRDYRAKVAALPTGSHGLGAHQFAKAKAIIAEILGGPVPVDPKGSRGWTLREWW